MSEFTKPAYNIHEHNHTEWSDEKLVFEMEKVIELKKIVPYIGERALQMDLREELIRREQKARYAETHPDLTSAEIQEQIDKEWSEYGRT